MGQLTNLYVSESYQGLLKLANSTTGVTGTLQYVQDGIGNNIPMLVSTSSVVITGSFRGDGSGLTGITVDSGSLVTTSSFNAFTASIDGRVDALEVATGSLQNQINQKLDTGSFNTYTSSNDAKVNALINATGSYATTSSLTSLSQSIAATDLSQDGRLNSIEGVTGSFATTSSLNSYTLTSSFNSYTSSANGRLSSLESATSSLQNQINQKLDTGSFNSYTSSNDAKVNALIGATGSYATTGSNTFIGTQTINGQLQVSDIVPSVGSDISIVAANVNVTGSLNVTGEITALSASITYLETIYQTSSVIFTSGSNILGDEPSDVQTLNGRVDIPLGNLNVTGATTSSLGFFGNLQGTASYATNALSSSHSVNADTASYVLNAVSSSYSNFALSSSFAQNATSASHAINADVAISSSQAQNAVSASHSINSDNSISSSFAQNAISSSHSVNSDSSISSSFALNANSASYAFNATSASWADNSNSASYAQNATSASYSLNSTSASFAQASISSSFSDFAVSSSQAQNAVTASFLLGTIASSSYAVNADTASIAYDVVVYGKCNNPGGLTRGTVVRIVGADGNNPLFDSASWTDDLNSANTLGVLSEDVASNAFANIVVQGKLIGINTSGFTAGDMMYLSSSGQYTTQSVPAPYHEVRLGQVLRVNQNNGSMYVNIDNGYELTELHDVDIQSVQVGDVLTYVSGAYGQWVNKTVDELGYLQTSSFNSYTASMDARTGSYATTGSNRFIGNQTITGSLNLSGSQSITQDLRLFSSASYGNPLVQPGAYITASAPVSQSNLIFASQNAAIGQGPFTTQSGSILLSGSNNILFSSNRGDTIAQGTIGYVGTNNLAFAIPTLNTGSSYRPTVNGNFLQGAVSLNLGTGSGTFAVNSNYLVGSIALNAPSASLGGTYTQNSILGNLGVQQTVPVTGSSAHSFASNVLNGALNIQVNSGSFQLLQNVINGTGIQITGSYRSTGAAATNGFGFNNNSINGLNNRFLFDGVANGSKGFFNSLVVGANNTASMVTNDTNGISNVGLIGRGLHVESGNGSGAGGAIFVGTFNQTGSLANPGDVKFAVGTGFDNTNRRTSLWVDSFGNSYVSSSLNVIGAGTNVMNVTGGTNISSSAAYALSITGALRVEGNTILNSVSTFPLYVSGTIQTQRLHFDGNPFNTNPASNLAALRYDLNNEGFSISNYDKAQISSGSVNELYLRTGSNYAHSKQTVDYAGTSAVATLANSNGTRTFDVNVDRMTLTGSLILSGSADPELRVIGNTILTGSVQGNVVPLSITSNTASLNLNDGNFFTLQLVSGSNTFINPSNIKAGQTVNILLNTTGSGTVSFPTSVKQVSGSAYVPTTTTSRDIITLVSFDSSDLYLANVKNLI